MGYRAVIFDLGGVVLGSPLQAIAQYEREVELPAGFVNRVVVDSGPTGAWSRLERGELPMDDFFGAFEQDCADAGGRIDARRMMQRMGEAAVPRPAMLEAIRRLRAAALRVGALTNNWESEASPASAESAAERPNDGTRVLRGHFDVFVESSVEGLRKPDPRIYELACRRLEVGPAEAVFLDDIGSNLKSARALGMATIKVEAPELALAELERLVGLDLVAL